MRLKKILHFFKKPRQHYKSELYKEQKVALLTKHSKEKVLAPILQKVLGCEIVHIDSYDTDQLGTFTREIAREGTQIEAARKKAHIALELSNHNIALASEGSFGADPYSGLFGWNLECLIWADALHSIEIVAMAEGKSNLAHAKVTSWQECEVFAKKVGFCEHFLIVRAGKDSSQMRKGVSEWSELKEAYEWAKDISPDGSVFLETDMRAFANPTRMSIIAKAAEVLAKKINSFCPRCNAPGYSIKESLAGLRCRACGQKTENFYADVYSCELCEHTETKERENLTAADPMYCGYCNP